MRAVTITLEFPDSSHIASQMFRPDSGFEREQIHHLNVLEDGSVVLLGRLRGDLDVARRVLDDHTDVFGYSISNADGDSGLVFVHVRAPPAIERFLTLPRTHEVFFEFPIESAGDGRLAVTMVGETNGVLQTALASVPGDLEITIDRIGPYPARGAGVVNVLTDRQLEVLDTALECGYYEVPRQATHRDIADRLGLTVGTVGEHLQKIESRIFTSLRG